MRRGHINPRSWDAAIRAVQKHLLEFPDHVPVTTEQDGILGAVYFLCEQLTARRHLVWVQSNRELARKYSISPRTVTNWRREGCPFADGKARVLDWMAERRYVPAGAKAKFGGRLTTGRRNWLAVSLRKLRAMMLTERTLHAQAGVPCPDWLRRMPFRQR